MKKNRPPISSRFRGFIRWIDKQGFSRRKLKENTWFKFFGDRIFHNSYWRFDRESVARGWLIGSLSASTPFMGIQTPMALPFVLYYRANFPICVLAVFMSNPFTAVPYYSFAYWLGCVITGIPMIDFKELSEMLSKLASFSNFFSNFTHVMAEAWEPFVALMAGCTVIGIVVGVVGYFVIRIGWNYIPGHRHDP